MKSNVYSIMELDKKKLGKQVAGAAAGGAAVGGAAYGLKKLGKKAGKGVTGSSDSVSSTLSGGVKDKDELGKLGSQAVRKARGWYQDEGRHAVNAGKQMIGTAVRHWRNAGKNFFKKGKDATEQASAKISIAKDRFKNFDPDKTPSSTSGAGRVVRNVTKEASRNNEERQNAILSALKAGRD